MNRFIKLYKDSVEKKLSFESRDFHFRITAQVIADFGTIEDLQELVNYHEKEKERINYERITAAV